MTGRDWSLSQPSFSDVERHAGPHYVLTIWPDGKLVLTTPSAITNDDFDHVNRVFQQWLSSEETYPLVIGNCLVQMQSLPVKEVLVEREARLRSARTGVHRGA